MFDSENLISKLICADNMLFETEYFTLLCKCNLQHYHMCKQRVVFSVQIKYGF